MASQLADLIRKKFPGQYDDMDDSALEKAVLSKHPEYKDLITPTTETKKEEPIPESTPTESIPTPSFMSKMGHALIDPLTTAPSRFAKSVADYMDQPSSTRSPLMARAAGFGAGALQGIGDLASNLTSPASLATMALTGGESFAGKAGYEGLANLLGIGRRIASAPFAGQGAQQLLSPSSTMGQRGMGLAEIAGGLSGMRKTPSLEAGPIESIKTKPTSFTEGMQPNEPPLLEHAAGNPIINLPHISISQTTKSETEPTMTPITRITNEGLPFASDKPETWVLKGHLTPEKIAQLRDMYKGGPEKGTVHQGYIEGPIEFNATDEFGNEIAPIPSSSKFISKSETEPSLTSTSENKSKWSNDTQRVINMRTGMANRLAQKQEGQNISTSDKPQQKLEVGTNVIIKADKATPELVKQAQEQGFEFQGLNDEGHFRFKKTSEIRTPQPILESEVGSTRPTTANVIEQQSTVNPEGHVGQLVDIKKTNLLAEAANFPRTVMASMDLSAPFRQGLGLIHKPEFWKAFPSMFKSWGSEAAFRGVQDSILERPLFKPRVGPNNRMLPSFAEDSGLKLTDLTDLSKREESMMSSLAEKIPGVRPSNRAYTAFLNKLRADSFENLINSGKVFGNDAKANLPLARGIADFVNTATGRGSLGKLEPAASTLSSVLFSPRLMASRLKMLNPAYYIMADPFVRKEALKSLFAIAAAGNIVTGLGRLAGGTVEMNPASADFGKLKVGGTRLDPYGGYQQYIVEAQRLMPHIPNELTDALGIPSIGGQMKSTETNREYNLGQPKFGQSDRADTAIRFMRGKTNPIINFAWGLMSGGKEISGQKMNLTTANPFQNAIAQRFIPMVHQDIYDMLTSDTPSHAIWGGPASTFGMGVQQYGR